MAGVTLLAGTSTSVAHFMEMVPVGDAGNSPDPSTGYGAVGYDFMIGTFEVTNAQYVTFLNSVAASDSYELYVFHMTSASDGGILRQGQPGSYTYSVKPGMEDLPVTYVSWFDAARFCNWLHNGMGVGSQNATTTEDGAYGLFGAMGGIGLAKNSAAKFWIPSEDEWYKAAYFRTDLPIPAYYRYATKSDSTPGTETGPLPNQANFDNQIGSLTPVGSFSGSASPYGTYDQAGNVLEWNDSISMGMYRCLRGGARMHYQVGAHVREINNPSSNGTHFGFRIAGFPSPIDSASGNGYSFANFAGRPGFAGNIDASGGEAGFRSPSGITVDTNGSFFVSDSANHTIRKVGPLGAVSTLAGKAGFLGSADGTGAEATFSDPQGLAADKAGNLYVAERGSHRIRRVSPAGVTTNYSGRAGFAGSADGTSAVFGGSADGTASPVRFNMPTDVAVDASGNVYVADSGNHAIRKITPDGVVTTMAGTLGAEGSSNATGADARFRSPQGIAVDTRGNVFVADTGNGLIRKISPARAVTTVAGGAFTGSADFTGRSTFVGSADITGVPNSTDGTGTNAIFSFPTDVEVDSAGNLFVTDSASSKIRKITPAGIVTTLGGDPDGFFHNPTDIAVDAKGVLHVADSGNHRIARGIISAVLVIPPTITSQPLSLTEYNGTQATFALAAAGSNLKYQWFLNGRAIPRATAPTYSVRTSATKAGDYHCVVSNALGSARSATATLTLRPAAEWTWSAGIADQKVLPGQGASFRIEPPNGPGTISFQWLKDGKPITRATSRELLIGEVGLSDAGLYSLVIKTAAGKVTTPPLRLIVGDPGLLVYATRSSGTLTTGAGKQPFTLTGSLLIDRDIQKGAFLWQDIKAKTYWIEMRPDLTAHSTGPSMGTTSLLSAATAQGQHPNTEIESIWLAGTDTLVLLGGTPPLRTLAPVRFIGHLNTLTLDQGTGIQTQSATLTLDKPATLKARQLGESLETALERIKSELAAKGFVEVIP
jgi:formylglycine-generating enzyme required for sulfatase activity/sugar lactone lactonase YvrE